MTPADGLLSATHCGHRAIASKGRRRSGQLVAPELRRAATGRELDASSLDLSQRPAYAAGDRSAYRARNEVRRSVEPGGHRRKKALPRRTGRTPGGGRRLQRDELQRRAGSVAGIRPDSRPPDDPAAGEVAPAKHTGEVLTTRRCSASDRMLWLR